MSNDHKRPPPPPPRHRHRRPQAPALFGITQT